MMKLDEIDLGIFILKLASFEFGTQIQLISQLVTNVIIRLGLKKVMQVLRKVSNFSFP